MRRFPGYICLCSMLFAAAPALASDPPPRATLQAIAAQLPHRPHSRGTTFQPADPPGGSAACDMRRFTMTLATGSSSARSLPVLLDNKPEGAEAPVTLLTVLTRVTVDADGSARAYHPEDPAGAGTCVRQAGPDGEERYTGVCALDSFASGEIKIFHDADRVGAHDFLARWKSLWPLIRDKKLTAFDLTEFVPSAPRGYYFFYWPEKSLTAFFKREIIPQAADRFPCRHGDASLAPGYFVAATTLQQSSDPPGDRCAPAQFIDAEHVPFFVLPDDAFGKAHVGDIVVARIDQAPDDRLVYGVVGDTGPIAHIGEASIAFNKALLAKSGPVMNGHDVEALDISGRRVVLLLFGGTRTKLNGDYSRHNIEAVGRQEFARWSGAAAPPTGRLDACVKQLNLGQ
jgi:hypothetical protein